jgi:hypothetical protein
MQSTDQAVLRATDCQGQRLPPRHGGLCEKTADFVEHFGQRKTPLETFTDLKNDTVTQPSFTPACPTARAWSKRLFSAVFRLGRTSGCDLTVEGEHVLENPLHLPPKEAILLCHCRRNFQPLTGQPTALEASAPFEFEPSRMFGKKPSTIKSFCIGTICIGTTDKHKVQ